MLLLAVSLSECFSHIVKSVVQVCHLVVTFEALTKGLSGGKKYGVVAHHRDSAGKFCSKEIAEKNCNCDVRNDSNDHCCYDAITRSRACSVLLEGHGVIIESVVSLGKGIHINESLLVENSCVDGATEMSAGAVSNGQQETSSLFTVSNGVFNEILLFFVILQKFFQFAF